MMKKYIAIALLSGAFLTSCGEYNRVLKSTDYEYKYEAAKSYFGKGQYTKASTILEELITILKGTENAQESLYMLAMSYYNQGDYVTASHYFTTYYNTYPKGTYTELARFHSGKALFLDTPEPRLDQDVENMVVYMTTDIQEQTAIANVLSDMDTEIATLETKLAKYRTLKIGMMQQLLTGKIRLV